jgi:adenosylcobinamide-GDP ribazoletransferase
MAVRQIIYRKRSGNGMRQSEMARRNWRDELRTAAMFLTRLPVRATGSDLPVLAAAAWAFPLIGLGVGLVSGLVFGVATWFGLTAWLAATFAVGAQIALTGALHEDGLADVADGFGGGNDAAAKLSIMRDSRIGAYGVIALMLILASRIGVLAALDDTATVIAALMVAGAASRTGMTFMMRALPPARDDGLGHGAGAPVADATVIALVIAVAAALVLLGFGGGLAALIGAGLGALGLAWLALRQIGGQTGDVLGAGQQAAEVLCLCAIVAAA